MNQYIWSTYKEIQRYLFVGLLPMLWLLAVHILAGYAGLLISICFATAPLIFVIARYKIWRTAPFFNAYRIDWKDLLVIESKDSARHYEEMIRGSGVTMFEVFLRLALRDAPRRLMQAPLKVMRKAKALTSLATQIKAILSNILHHRDGDA
jgi:hypothetical protein